MPEPKMPMMPPPPVCAECGTSCPESECKVCKATNRRDLLIMVFVMTLFLSVVWLLAYVRG